MIGRHVYYSGKVQGVGFRYAARETAQGFAVTGYVRNLSNGQVELVAEGSQTEVEAFLAALAQRMKGHIREQTVTEHSPGGCEDFTIRL